MTGPTDSVSVALRAATERVPPPLPSHLLFLTRGPMDSS